MSASEADLQAIIDEQPATARALVPVLGFERTAEICHRLGGHRFYIGNRTTGRAAQVLTEGERAAIFGVRGRGHWDVPMKCSGFRAVRDAHLLAGSKGGMSSNDLAAPTA